MKIFWDKPIDVSLLIHEDMLFWPNDPKFQREWVAKISEGKNANLSKITLGSHTGTHIDTPYHFLDHGKTLENIDISRFYGFAKVFEIKNPNKILLQDIETLPIEEGDIILFKTKNSLLLKENIFHDDYVGLSLEAARYLADKNVKTIEDLTEGMELPGIVNNITNFGCFVDIGIKEKGLVHVSQLADKFVSDPTTVVSIHQHVRVKVMSIDLERKRIQLTMKGLNQ